MANFHSSSEVKDACSQYRLFDDTTQHTPTFKPSEWIQAQPCHVIPGSESLRPESKDFRDQALESLNQDSTIKVDLGFLHEENHKGFDKVIGPPKMKKHRDHVLATGVDKKTLKEGAVGYKEFSPEAIPLGGINTIGNDLQSQSLNQILQQKGGGYREFHPPRSATVGYNNIVGNLDSLHLAPRITPGQTSLSGLHFKDKFSSIGTTSGMPQKISYARPNSHYPDARVGHPVNPSAKPQGLLEYKRISMDQMPLPSVIQGEHWVIVRAQGKVIPFDWLTHLEIAEKVNQVLIELEERHNMEKMRVIDCVSLAEGHVKLSASSPFAARWMRTNLRKWAPLVDPRLKFNEFIYKIVITNLAPIPEDRSSLQFFMKLCESNKIDPQHIHRIAYSTLSSRTSMMIITPKPELVARIEKEGLLVNGLRVKGHRYQSVVEECDQCLGVGHHYYECLRPILCENCGGGHWSSQCRENIPKRNHEVCYVCKWKFLHSKDLFARYEDDQMFHHSWRSDMCPVRVQEIKKLLIRKDKNQQLDMEADRRDKNKGHNQSSD